MWWVKFAETAAVVTGPFGLGGIVVAATLALNLKREERALVEEFDIPLIDSTDSLTKFLKQFKTAKEKKDALKSLLAANRTSSKNLWAKIEAKVDLDRYLRRKQAARKLRFIGTIFVFLAVLLYGAAVTGKRIEVREIERKTHDLITIFRDAKARIESVIVAPNTTTSTGPKSIVQLSGIVAEDVYLLNNSVHQGDGERPELTGSRRLADVENARKAYFSRLQSLYEDEQGFWNQLTDASAEAADIVVRIEQLGQDYIKLDSEILAQLKLSAQRIIDGVTRYREFTSVTEIKTDEVWLAYLQRDWLAHGIERKGITDKTYPPPGLTPAMFLRRTIGEIEATNIPATIAVLEALKRN